MRNLFSKADDFASECLQKARPFERGFRPGGGSRVELETFKVYFQAVKLSSRFLLGCVLNFKSKIAFAGVYYSHKPLDMRQFDQLPFDFVDFFGNVGVDIDGRKVTILAIRQFGTKNIPEQFHEYKSNCEPQDMENFGGQVATIPYGWRYTYRETDELQPFGHDDEPVPPFPVNRFFGEHKHTLVYTNDLNSIFVDAGGVLMLRNDLNFPQICKLQKHDAADAGNIFYEMCDAR